MIKPLSWSEYSTYKWNKDKWYSQYILGQKEEPNEQMIFGKRIHEEIQQRLDPKDSVPDEQKDKCLVEWLREKGCPMARIARIQRVLAKKQLQDIKRKARGINIKREVVVDALLGDVPLIAIFDGLDPEYRFLDEDKTTDESRGKWWQGKVDDHGQLSFYALIFRLRYFNYFKEITLNQINTTGGTMKTFETARGPKDIEDIKSKILGMVEECRQSGLWDKRLTTAERNALANRKLPL